MKGFFRTILLSGTQVEAFRALFPKGYQGTLRNAGSTFEGFCCGTYLEGSPTGIALCVPFPDPKRWKVDFLNVRLPLGTAQAMWKDAHTNLLRFACTQARERGATHLFVLVPDGAPDERHLLSSLSELAFSPSGYARSVFVLSTETKTLVQQELARTYRNHLTLPQRFSLLPLSQLGEELIAPLHHQAGQHFPWPFFPAIYDPRSHPESSLFLVDHAQQHPSIAGWLVLKKMDTHSYELDPFFLFPAIRNSGVFLPFLYESLVRLSPEIHRLVFFVNEDNSPMQRILQLFAPMLRFRQRKIEWGKKLRCSQ